MTDVATDEATMDSSAQSLALAPLGEVLLAGRDAKNLTQKDVSDNLRISIKQISALENNDFAALPEAMITRGFIRNYARLLELDADSLLDSYRARVPDKSPGALSVQSSTYQVLSGKDNQSWLKYILASTLVLLFLPAWIFYIDYMPKSAKPSVAKVSEVVDVTAASTEMPLPEIALPAAERQAEVVDAVAAVTASEPSVEHANNLPDTHVGEPVPATKSVQEANVVVKEEVTAHPVVGVTKKVSLSVAEEAWVNVTDMSGKVIYAKILPAGTTDGFDGTPPFNVVIGNAKATKLSFLGKSVDLTPSTTQNNVARIKLE